MNRLDIQSRDKVRKRYAANPLYLMIQSIGGKYIRPDYRLKLRPEEIFQILMGCIAGIVSVVVIAKLFGASDAVIMSLASKSVTTPIAMEVTQVLGGIPSLTAAIVVITGLIGAVIGFKTLSAC